jgi:hypothetical protein
VEEVWFFWGIRQCDKGTEPASLLIGKPTKLEILAADFAARHDGGVQAVTKIFGHFVDFVAAVNLNCLAGGVEDDFAVAALLQVQFDLSSGLGGNRVVNQVIENGKKLSAGHAAASGAECIMMGKKVSIVFVRLGLTWLASFP